MPVTLSQWKTPAPEQILDVTREVLNRPEFRAASAWQQWLHQVYQQIDRTLTDGFRWLQAYPTLQWVVFAVLSLLLLGLLAHLVSMMWAETRLLTRARSSHHGTQPLAPSRPDLPAWDVVQQEVRQALQQGDTYRAIRHLHQYFLVVLDSRGLLTFTGWKTNADYLRECPSEHPSYATLASMSEIYEHVVYAHRELPLQTLTTLLTQVEHDQVRCQP